MSLLTLIIWDQNVSKMLLENNLVPSSIEAFPVKTIEQMYWCISLLDVIECGGGILPKSKN